MTGLEFEEALNIRLEKIKTVLGVKADEYGRADRLHNFVVAAKIARTTPAKACVGMLMKHFVSVLDLVDDDALGETGRVQRLLDEKVGDLINYAILLEMLLRASPIYTDDKICADVSAEAERAAALHGKLPTNPLRVLVLLQEELGEASSAVLDLTRGVGTVSTVVSELVQIIVLASGLISALRDPA